MVKKLARARVLISSDVKFFESSVSSLIPDYVDQEGISSDINDNGIFSREGVISHHFDSAGAPNCYHNYGRSASQSNGRNGIDTIVADYMKASNVSKLLLYILRSSFSPEMIRSVGDTNA